MCRRQRRLTNTVGRGRWFFKTIDERLSNAWGTSILSLKEFGFVMVIIYIRLFVVVVVCMSLCRTSQLRVNVSTQGGIIVWRLVMPPHVSLHSQFVCFLLFQVLGPMSVLSGIRPAAFPSTSPRRCEHLRMLRRRETCAVSPTDSHAFSLREAGSAGPFSRCE